MSTVDTSRHDTKISRAQKSDALSVFPPEKKVRHSRRNFAKHHMRVLSPADRKCYDANNNYEE